MVDVEDRAVVEVIVTTITEDVVVGVELISAVEMNTMALIGAMYKLWYGWSN